MIAASEGQLPFTEIRRQCAETLQHDLALRSQIGHDVGWGHNVKSVGQSTDKPTTALASAYGLKVNRSLGDPVPLRQQEAVARWILTQRGSNGLWRARTQQWESAEISATILTGVVTSVGLLTTEDAVEIIEANASKLTDYAGRPRVFAITSVICSLVSVNPQSKAIPALIVQLCSGATPQPHGVAWGQVTMSVPEEASAAHTARAVTALARANNLGILNTGQKAQLDSGLDYLESLDPDDFGLDTESIERSVDGGTDVLVVRHFTAALVLRTLAESGRSVERHEALSKAVMSRFRDGAFWWNSEAPIWMMYQGLSALERAVIARAMV
ncbi:hypothetical protein C6A86_011405 [Mycobacterium sp. ITM-2016-00316]|uniref:hypothetical protein n=1 Tax=Mycobacterium sp. ITM-2016-00316 TaxID=2099695 RepID=UPI000CF9D54A|nr:hypothetical protein [Mycobacterium sp. ITM-2016-00316]WNG84192.1 hypothetical protein C6A86_011405 [Mycobacterium sp. ITM-2016-00316]